MTFWKAVAILGIWIGVGVAAKCKCEDTGVVACFAAMATVVVAII